MIIQLEMYITDYNIHNHSTIDVFDIYGVTIVMRVRRWSWPRNYWGFVIGARSIIPEYLIVWLSRLFFVLFSF